MFSSQVIDDEKKMKDLEQKKKSSKKNKDSESALDVPYPDGVRKRSRIRTYDIKNDELDEDRNLLEAGKSDKRSNYYRLRFYFVVKVASELRC